MRVNEKLHLTAGSTADDGYQTKITPLRAGWTYSGLRILVLEPGGRHELATGDEEMLVLPLEGGCTVGVDGQVFQVTGRASVFAGVTDFVYLPKESRAEIGSAAGGRFALPSAQCRTRLTARYGPAGQVPVELRGAGRCSRQVNNFCTPQSFAADRLIACEVLTPGGNWSSYPPHKHDEERAGESELEEIYYFEIQPGPGGPGLAYQRVYSSGDRPIDVLAEVRGGDVVLIPYGWHGPSMAAPGNDLYYLNVMAGPGAERAWLICDDPAHAWIRGTWPDQEIDPRLPIGRAQ
jgi:5-deoxy-glucuronate isomerase